ncbi:MAG: aminoglycoside phosphotransferase family protein [Paracoccaceae bacterium]
MTIRAFLDQAGWSEVAVMALTPDASVRRYWRLAHPKWGRALLCHDPSAQTARFAHQADALRVAGVCAPKVLACRSDAMVIEDFGDLSVTQLAQDAAQEPQAYGLAGAVLAQAQAHMCPAGLIVADVVHLVQIIEPFCATHPVRDAAGLRAALTAALDTHMGAASVWIHRDFHADNLMWRPQHSGLARLGVLDFQDAMRGPAAYDLASLLYDARRDVRESAYAAALRGYLDATGAASAPTETAMAVLSLQRNLRILGLFAQFAAQGRSAYQRFVPRVRQHVARALAHPACADVARFVPAEAQ